MTSGPLAGIKVVEFAGIGPGPAAGMMLADMGAEVILIERKTRNAVYAGLKQDDFSKTLIFNRGKRSIMLNLKTPEGVALALKLIDTADIVIEGFRPGVMERLGLGPDACLDRNRRLVYGRMTGWGQSGPIAKAAGHDPNYIGISGALWHGGGKTHAPRAPLTLVGDVGGGTMVLLWGVMCALNHARNSGEGQVVDAAMTDGSAYISSLLWSMHASGQLTDDPGANWVDGAAPWNDTYRCADGQYVTVCAIEPRFYAILIERLGLANDPQFADQYDSGNWPAAKEKISRLFLGKSRKHWCDLLEGTDACFAPVLNFEEAPRHPHNIARQTFVNVDGITQPAPAPRLSRSKPRAGKVPGAGEHTDEILGQTGLQSRAIEDLKARGVI